MNIDIKITEEDLLDVRIALGRMAHRSRQAVSGAINETLAEVKTRSARNIYKRFNLTSARIKKDIHVKRSTPATLTGEVRYERTRPIGLRQFGARQTAKGVSYAIVRGKKQFIPHAFIQTAKGGEHVFIRYKGPGPSGMVGRFKIHRLVGISVQEAFVRSGLAEKEFIDAEATFRKNLDQRVNGIIRGFVKGRRAA